MNPPTHMISQLARIVVGGIQRQRLPVRRCGRRKLPAQLQANSEIVPGIQKFGLQLQGRLIGTDRLVTAAQCLQRLAQHEVIARFTGIGRGGLFDEQQRRIRGRALEMGWTLTEIFVEEGVSDSVPLDERPQGARLLRTVQSGDIVVCAKLDRAFRSAIDALQTIAAFKRRKISLWVLDIGGDCLPAELVGRVDETEG